MTQLRRDIAALDRAAAELGAVRSESAEVRDVWRQVMEENPQPASKEEMWRRFLDVNRTLIESTGLDRELSAQDGGHAIFDPMERIVGVRRRREMRSFREAFKAAVRARRGQRPRWRDVDLDALQAVVDAVGVPDDCPRKRLVLPFDPTAKRRGRASEAETEALAYELRQLGLTFDEALDELRRERAAGQHPFVSRNLVLDRLWRNVQAHLDALGTEGSPQRAEFLFKIDPRRLTGGSRSRASKFLAQRIMALNPSRARRNPATGDYLFDERARVADVLPGELAPAPGEREPGSDDEGGPF